MGGAQAVRVLRVSHSAVVDAWRERERHLRALGHDVHLLSAAVWDEAGMPVPLVPRPGEPVQGVATVGRHPALFLYDPRPLWRALGEPWDVLDLHEEPFALATAELLLLRAMRARHTPYVLYSAQNLDKRYPLPFRVLQRWALRHARGVSVCNEAAGDLLIRRGFPGRPQVIPLGIDPGVFAAEPARLPPEPGGRIVVGYAGRLASHKGIDVLFDAVAHQPRLHVRLAGAGPAEAGLRERARAEALAGRVTFTGALETADLAGFYRGLDVLAIPSLTTPGWVEQFGRVAVEAMASGIPVVASDSGALPDVVGGAGVLVPPGDAQALGAALVSVVDDAGRWERMRAAGLARASGATWPQVAQRYQRLYRLAAQTPAALDRDRPVEVVVVAYGTPDLLERSLRSVAGLPVTVVDNSASVDVREVCRAAGVRYLDAGGNRGFGRGVNIALRERLVPGADVLLLNPDAVLDPVALDELRAALAADPQLASAGPSQVDEAGRRTRVGWSFPSPVRSWVAALGLGRVLRAAGWREPVDYAIGSVLLLRAEAIEHVGGFDEDFFLYAEETDWARRAALLGWRHTVVASVSVLHTGAATSTDSARREILFIAGLERYLRKHHGAMGWAVARAGEVAGAAIRAAVTSGVRSDRARRRLRVLCEGPLRLEQLHLPPDVRRTAVSR